MPIFLLLDKQPILPQVTILSQFTHKSKRINNEAYVATHDSLLITLKQDGF